jgi:ferredoxin
MEKAEESSFFGLRNCRFNATIETHYEGRCVGGERVTDACVNCGSCDSECSVGAISEKDGKRFVDPAACVSCGACAGACPTEAIVEE